jgi:hypothetical protein
MEMMGMPTLQGEALAGVPWLWKWDNVGRMYQRLHEILEAD